MPRKIPAEAGEREHIVNNINQIKPLVKLLEIIFGQEAETTPVWWQTAHDGVKKDDPRFDKSLTRSFQATVADALPRLQQLNDSGAAVWFMAARSADSRKIQSITDLPCLRFEIDGALPELPLEPSAIVRTPNGYHVYYRCTGLTTGNYDGLVRGAVATVGGDKRAVDTARVLRAPCFYHLKDKPTMITLESTSNACYTFEQLVAVFGFAPKEEKSLVAPREKAATALKGNERFEFLRNGGELLRDGKPDRSAGDMAFLRLLAIKTDCNASEMDAQFRGSARMRKKWDEKHYANGDTFGQRAITEIIQTHKPLTKQRKPITRQVQSVVAAYLEQRQFAEDLILNRKAHTYTREMYVKMVHGIFECLSRDSIQKEIVDDRLYILISWDSFCHEFCLDDYKARKVRQYLEMVMGLGCVNGKMHLPVKSPREWLQQLGMIEIVSYNKLIGYKPKHKTKQEPVSTPVQPNRLSLRTCGDTKTLIERQKEARQWRKGYHKQRYAKLYRSYRRLRVQTARYRAWLESEMAYHQSAITTLAALN